MRIETSRLYLIDGTSLAPIRRTVCPTRCGIPWRDNRRTRLSLRAFLPPPFSSLFRRPRPVFHPAFSISPLRSCSRARRASSRSIGHCTRRRFSRAVSRVDARGMQPKAADVHRGRPKWATSVALAAATVISSSMHSHAQALCMHDSARMTQPARRTRNTTLTRLHVGASHLRVDTENKICRHSRESLVHREFSRFRSYPCLLIVVYCYLPNVQGFHY